MAFYFYLSTKIIMVFITKSYQDLFGVRSYINALYFLFFAKIHFFSFDKNLRIIFQYEVIRILRYFRNKN